MKFRHVLPRPLGWRAVKIQNSTKDIIMATCSVTSETDECQISIENKGLNLFRNEDVDDNVIFSLGIPRSMIWNWRDDDPNLNISFVNRSILRLGVKLEQSCDDLRHRF